MDFTTTPHGVLAMFTWFCYEGMSITLLRADYGYGDEGWTWLDCATDALTTAEYALLRKERDLRCKQWVRVVLMTAEKVFPNVN
jgi:hypothetical protein